MVKKFPKLLSLLKNYMKDPFEITVSGKTDFLFEFSLVIVSTYIGNKMILIFLRMPYIPSYVSEIQLTQNGDSSVVLFASSPVGFPSPYVSSLYVPTQQYYTDPISNRNRFD
jgi:hypothetical protein